MEVPWHLCFATQLRASKIPSYHALLWSLQPSWCYSFILSTFSYLFTSHELEWIHKLYYPCSSYHALVKHWSWNSLMHFIWIEKCLSKFSFSHPVCQLNCLRTSNKLSLGELIRRKRIYFSKHFSCCFSSKLAWFGSN